MRYTGGMNENIIVILGALIVIGLIVWWFFGARPQEAQEATLGSDGSQQVSVAVDGGYVPHTVVLRQGVPAQLVFERKDPSGCFNEVMFPDFGIHEVLKVGVPHPITLDTSKAGEYSYVCGMNMFHGKVVIRK